MRDFQAKGASWMYLAEKGLNADQVGLGKTIQSLALVCLLRAQGRPSRTLVLCPKSAQLQWEREALRFTRLNVAVAHGSPWERAHQYMANWDVMISTYPLLLRDAEYINELDLDLILLDEASVFRHHRTQTHKAVKRLTSQCERVILLDATPYQTELIDLHGILEPLHMSIFGPLRAFDRRYVRREERIIYKGRKRLQFNKVVGYRNVDELKARVQPFMIRRRATDAEVDADLPEIVTNTHWFELPRKQRTAYNNAVRSVKTLFDSGKRTQARASFHLLQQACDTTRHFDDAEGESVKIDWLVDQVSGGGIDSAVVFAQHLETVAHVVDALTNAGVGVVRYTGEENEEARQESLRAFWDGAAQVIVGTTALERSLNLQRTAHLVNISQLWNPSRMVQLAGRVRRIGSVHPRVIVVNLLTRDTHEEKLSQIQSERAAVSDHVLDESESIFAALSDEQLRDLVGG